MQNHNYLASEVRKPIIVRPVQVQRSPIPFPFNTTVSETIGLILELDGYQLPIKYNVYSSNNNHTNMLRTPPELKQGENSVAIFARYLQDHIYNPLTKYDKTCPFLHVDKSAGKLESIITGNMTIVQIAGPENTYYNHYKLPIQATCKPIIPAGPF